MNGIIAFALLLSGLVFITSQTTQAQKPISIELVLAVDASAFILLKAVVHFNLLLQHLVPR